MLVRLSSSLVKNLEGHRIDGSNTESAPSVSSR